MDANQPNTWNYRGLCLFRLGQFEKARSDFAEFIKLDPENVVAWGNRGAAHKALGDFELAIADADAALKLNPTHTPALRLRARSNAGMNNWSVAIEDFSKLIELEPTKIEHLLERGKAYDAAGDKEKSQLDFDQYVAPFDSAVAKNRDDWQTINRRGVAQTKVYRWDQAKQDFNRALELAPEEIVLRKNLAHCLCELGEWTSAADNLAKALELGETSWLAYYHLALCQLSANDLEGYRDTCQSMAKAFAETTDPTIANFVAWTCCLGPQAQEDFSITLSLANMAVAANAESKQYLNTLGAIQFRAGNPDAAIETLNQVSKLDPTNANNANVSPAYTWFFLVMAQKAEGNENENEKTPDSGQRLDH